MQGRHLSDHAKEIITCNASHMNLRDEGGLMCLKEEISLIGGITIQFFERVIKHNVMRKECYVSCSYSRIALMVFKSLTTDATNESPFVNATKGKCGSCSANMTENIVAPMFNTLFNFATNNFVILLSRKELDAKLTLKMVKEPRKKNRHEKT